MIKGLLLISILTSCSTFSTGFSHAIKLEHEVEAATEAAQAAYQKSATPIVVPAQSK